MKVKTFARRVFSCGHYKEEDNYAKNVRLFFENTIKNYTKRCINDSTSDITSILDGFDLSRTFKGPKHIYLKDRGSFESYCRGTLSNLIDFATEHGEYGEHSSNLLETNYKYCKLSGSVGWEARINKDHYTVDLSFYNKEITYYNLYYHKFNCWLYNQTNSVEHDALIFVVPDGLYYLLKYNKNNYTISSDYIEANRTHSVYNPGYQCKTCKIKNCKPRLLPNLQRL